MNRLIIGLGVFVAMAAGAWFLSTASNTYDVVATVDAELDQLEAELQALDEAVAAGTLTEEQATAAKVQIVKRLDTITKSTSNTCDRCITPAQRAQLLEGLDRLKNILVTYQDTLTSVEQAADEEAVEKQLRRGGRNDASRPLSIIVADTIVEVEDTIDEIVTTGEEATGDSVESETNVEETESETIIEETTETEPTGDSSETTEDTTQSESESETEVTTDNEVNTEQTETAEEPTVETTEDEVQS